MFYCDNCAKIENWPPSFSVSFGVCEMCGEKEYCNDRPSSSLPDTLYVTRERTISKILKNE